jgi:hypothetical protein
LNLLEQLIVTTGNADRDTHLLSADFLMLLSFQKLNLAQLFHQNQ